MKSVKLASRLHASICAEMNGIKHWWQLQPTTTCREHQGKILLSCSLLGIEVKPSDATVVQTASIQNYESTTDSCSRQLGTDGIDDCAATAPEVVHQEQEQSQVRNEALLRERIEAIYGKYNPTKLKEVPALLEKYGKDAKNAMLLEEEISKKG